MKILKSLKTAILALAVILVPVAPAFSQDKKDTGKAPEVTVPQSLSFSGAALGAGLGMGITIVGAGYGLGKIGSAALEGMARQPEVAPRIQTAMLIIAAMLEGATLASVIFCFLVGNKATF
jgi:F-type H+-transporting ATPase subunit c